MRKLYFLQYMCVRKKRFNTISYKQIIHVCYLCHDYNSLNLLIQKVLAIYRLILLKEKPRKLLISPLVDVKNIQQYQCHSQANIIIIRMVQHKWTLTTQKKIIECLSIHSTGQSNNRWNIYSQHSILS